MGRPGFGKDAFNCPRCGAYTHFEWENLFTTDNQPTPVWMAVCARKKERTYWIRIEDSGVMVYPNMVTAPNPHSAMPGDVTKDFEEARQVQKLSPKAAAALLRLAIQKLCVHLGGTGENVNNDIAMLVGKGLDPDIQQALDILRVVGNNAVHPGFLDDADMADVSERLFELVNIIVEDRIARPAKIKELYNRLPDGSREAIGKRDQKK